MKYLEIEPKIKSCQVYADIPYRKVDGKNLYLHLILPTTLKQTDERFPCIIYIPGSAYGVQRVGREIPQLCRMAQKGYVVVCIQYRHAAWAPFPAQAIDAKYAVDFIFKHAEQYFVDNSRMILWGDSSGAQTALLAGYTKENSMFLEAGLKEHEIKCVIDYFAPIDLSKFL
jgi:acetyl esterase/lipase